MITTFFPVKKLRRNGKHVLFGAILLVAAVAVYHEMVAAKAWSEGTGTNSDDGSGWRGATLDQRVGVGHPLEDSAFMPQAWKPEYEGQANLHVFEDWCGSSTDGLRRNLHYPLYPHSRTIVHKLAISPQWTNYGLRIFGYLHPYTDGEFVFALSSDDNSEFWLSTDDSPSHLQLLAWVGKTGSEWTAPGEFEKYASQISTATQLSAQRRYFFELIHKQNDRGTDHVEVAWKLLDEDVRFMVIESKYISLYVNESALLMSDVAHIPQTAASHRRRAPWKHSAATADLLREDARDAPHRGSGFLQGVLPDCSYKPSYTIKDFPLTRYQGLQFVHMSFIYPNDYTRLTHMEKENSCFYPENPSYMKMFGFSRYMRLDLPDGLEKKKSASDYSFQRRKSVMKDDKFGKDMSPSQMKAKAARQNNLFSDYGDDYDDYVLKRRRKLFSMALSDSDTLKKSHDTSRHEAGLGRGVVPHQKEVAETFHLVATQSSKQQKLRAVKPEVPIKIVANVKLKRKQNSAKRPKLKSVEQLKPTLIRKKLGTKHINSKWKAVKMNQTHVQTGKNYFQLINAGVPKIIPTEVAKLRFTNSERSNGASKIDIKSPLVTAKQRNADTRKTYMEKEMEMPGLQDTEKSLQGNSVQKWSKVDQARKEKVVHKREESRRESRASDADTLWGLGGDFDDEDLTPAPGFDPEVDWSQTFHVNHVDLQAMRSDWIDLHCNVSGNLLLHSTDALPVAKAFVAQLNEKNEDPFTLVRVVNVEKRVDGVQGSRYLLELELKDAKGQLLRLSHYIYTLIRNRTRPRSLDLGFRRPKPQLVLCNPVGFYWNPVAMIHFIVPVKNQARWVQQLIDDMVGLFKATVDANFNLIITDFNSTDMDVRAALKKSSLPRYQYVKLSGNFERSAGLQAGIDLINDDHSIVFLCDLHIQFPPSIMDSIRKHCIEGFMAFAPIVMRLDCGATPSEGRGYWEVNGFGLLGIYKSDLDAVGGMNTKEFTNRWGGEDWELLDRILQAGLEVERLYLRNFFHHYHSKRGMWNRQVSPGPR
ncbi:beta-1,4-N-acetylgalactosaminyltransferase 3 isoform X2 [Phycodurus eques]|uniref:beta-1,4-N-acetylgalactosaminyltransferase 3 isoform X2 n=1 Tax=Phycodurus eques TaxID=693459 RepID=UPI002ACDAC3D|nr:beta-1,4-N-acetylgalactosaminyltransferase 3 isoform X2 [Phycodurus eques]